jgi:malonate transporter and related proteins
MSGALLLLPDFLLIVLGVVLKRVRGFGAPFWGGLERLVYFVLFPALLFRSLAQSPLALADAGRLAAVALVFTASGMALSALARPLFNLDSLTFASCFQCGFRFNTYIALAAASRIGGEAGVALVSVLIGVLVPVVNFAAVAMLARGGRGRIALELARNPLVIAALLGFAWQLGGIPLPGIARRILELLAGAALPLGLLAVGAGLRLSRGTLPLPALAWWHAIKLFALPAIAYALTLLVAVSPAERQIAVAMAAVPTAPSAYVLATQMGGHGAAVAMLISSGTLIAALTLPLWLAATAP